MTKKCLDDNFGVSLIDITARSIVTMMEKVKNLYVVLSEVFRKVTGSLDG